MIDPEVERQIGCVVNRLRQISEMRVKGHIVVHLDGSGAIGKHIETHLVEWRDKYSPEKVGIQIDE